MRGEIARVRRRPRSRRQSLLLPGQRRGHALKRKDLVMRGALSGVRSGQPGPREGQGMGRPGAERAVRRRVETTADVGVSRGRGGELRELAAEGHLIAGPGRVVELFCVAAPGVDGVGDGCGGEDVADGRHRLDAGVRPFLGAHGKLDGETIGTRERLDCVGKRERRCRIDEGTHVSNASSRNRSCALARSGWPERKRPLRLLARSARSRMSGGCRLDR